MNTPLSHSPADIIAQLLIDLGLATDPDDTDAWPVYSTDEPDLPDNCITCYDTAGRDVGRTMKDGERQQYPGIQLRIRCARHEVGFVKAQAIAIALDEQVAMDYVTLDAVTYTVQSVLRTGTVVPIGKEVPGSARRAFTINGLVTVWVSDPEISLETQDGKALLTQDGYAILT